VSEQGAQSREATERNEQREIVLRLALAYGAAAVAAVALLLYGYLNENIGVMALGGLAIVLVLAVAPVSFMAAAGGGGGAGPGVDMLIGEMRQLRRTVERLSEFQALSDDARRVLNRARERELLIRAIEEDITAEDWGAAVVLCNELADRFGYREDAEQFRQRVEQARSATRDRNVTGAIAALDGLIVQRRWEHAVNHAASIQRLYPDSPRIGGLRQRVENARERYKTDLERRFLHAAQSENPEEAMELLKELDAYLTEAEAEPYRELARGIIGKARENLGASFKLAVRDKRWRDAALLGERIIAEFPNTRMAEEVRSMIDGVRQRASTLAG
jgi:DNA primase